MHGLISGTIRQLDPASGLIVLGARALQVMPNVSLISYAVGMHVIATYREQHGEYWLTGIDRERPAQSRLTDRRAS